MISHVCRIMIGNILQEMTEKPGAKLRACLAYLLSNCQASYQIYRADVVAEK